MVSLEQFAEIIGVDILLRRYAGQNGRWMAQLDRAEVKGDGVLIGSYGNDSSPSAAIADYCRQIAGKTIFVTSGSQGRQTFNVPKDLQ
jgi:CBS domain containing-hemolysin-like protein